MRQEIIESAQNRPDVAVGIKAGLEGNMGCHDRYGGHPTESLQLGFKAPAMLGSRCHLGW